MSRWDVRPADVVLGTLDAAGRVRAETLIREDAGFRAEVARLQRAGDALASLDAAAWAPEAPAPLALSRAPAARRVRALRLRPALAVLAAVALLGVGAAAGALLEAGDGDVASPGAEVALAPPAGSRGPQRASVVLPGHVGGTADVSARGLAPTRAGDYYEVWLMTDATHLVSVGSFRVGRSGTAEVRMPTAVDPRRYRYLDVSLEHDDGDPGHSSVSVLRSRALS